MSAWIELDNVRSTAFSNTLVTNVTPFLKARRKAARTAVSGRLGQIDNGEPTLETADVQFTLAVYGDGRTDAMSRARQLLPWLNGTKLRTYLEPDKYCIGAIESEIRPSKESRKLITIECTFTANPGCMYHPVGDFDPDIDTPVQEQITAENALVSGTFTDAGRLTAMQGGGTYGPALYFAITGTWEYLSIGGLTLTQPAENQTTAYLDCENQIVYRYDSNNKVAIPISGSFPENDPDGIIIGGTDFSVTVLGQMIERW